MLNQRVITQINFKIEFENVAAMVAAAGVNPILIVLDVAHYATSDILLVKMNKIAEVDPDDVDTNALSEFSEEDELFRFTEGIIITHNLGRRNVLPLPADDVFLFREWKSDEDGTPTTFKLLSEIYRPRGHAKHGRGGDVVDLPIGGEANEIYDYFMTDATSAQKISLLNFEKQSVESLHVSDNAAASLVHHFDGEDYQENEAGGGKKRIRKTRQRKIADRSDVKEKHKK